MRPTHAVKETFSPTVGGGLLPPDMSPYTYVGVCVYVYVDVDGLCVCVYVNVYVDSLCLCVYVRRPRRHAALD